MKSEFNKKYIDPTATDLSIYICSKLKDYFIENGMKHSDIADKIITFEIFFLLLFIIIIPFLHDTFRL